MRGRSKTSLPSPQERRGLPASAPASLGGSACTVPAVFQNHWECAQIPVLRPHPHQLRQALWGLGQTSASFLKAAQVSPMFRQSRGEAGLPAAGSTEIWVAGAPGAAFLILPFYSRSRHCHQQARGKNVFVFLFSPPSTAYVPPSINMTFFKSTHFPRSPGFQTLRLVNGYRTGPFARWPSSPVSIHGTPPGPVRQARAGLPVCR